MADMRDHEWFCERTGNEIDRLAGVAGGANPAAEVATCPGWTMARLVKHTGIVHRWVTQIVSARSSSWLDPRELDVGLPDKESGYAGWLAAGAEPLLQALRDAGPGTSVWTWGTGQTSGWWGRRMLHETTVHRADAELATGIAPSVDPEVAADGIDEFLANLPAARRPSEHLAELPAGESLHLHATDSDGEWLIRFPGGGQVAWERGHAKATAAVRGPVASLLLFTYGRIPPGDENLAIFGDTSLLRTWQQKAAL